jgi:hypothetical protein
MGVTRKNLLMAPTRRQEIHDKFHGDSCACDYRLAGKNLGIDGNSVSQFHVSIIQQLRVKIPKPQPQG